MSPVGREETFVYVYVLYSLVLGISPRITSLKIFKAEDALPNLFVQRQRDERERRQPAEEGRPSSEEDTQAAPLRKGGRRLPLFVVVAMWPCGPVAL